MDKESALNVVKMFSKKDDIIISKDIQSSIFDLIAYDKLSIIQEIRKNNLENQIVSKITDRIFPEKPSLDTKITYKKVKKVLSFKEYPSARPSNQTFFNPETKFSCDHALCYQQEGLNDYFRIFLEQHTVSYGPKGSIIFYIPKKERYSLYTPFYPLDSSMKKIKAGSRPITMKFWDARRKNIFHLMLPALDTLYPDNSTYPYVYRDEYFQYRFDPMGSASEEWFAMGWEPHFKGRDLTTILLTSPEIRLVKDEFNIQGSKKFLVEYFKKFPVSDYLRMNEIFQNLGYSERHGVSIRFNSDFKIVGLNKRNPTDLFPHYLREPTPEDLHHFWSERDILAKYYEVRLKLYSYVADE